MRNYRGKGDIVDVVFPAAADSGDMVAINNLVGIACNAQAANSAGPLLVRGLVSYAVTAEDDAGNSAVDYGDNLYIDPATGTVNKDSTKTFAGKALGTIAAGETATIDILLG